MTAWYNENDPYAAQWLRNLIEAGHIAPGIVDERDIREVEAFELVEFTQCHFFAGIGIWSGALRAAEYSDDRPIWTGSCPCQPFSAAGKQKGFADDRHLWPYWFNLIAQCKPPIVIGEQVDKALAWIDLVSGDLEGKDYAIGSTILSAAGFSGAHIRHRNYFVGLAHHHHSGLQGQHGMSERADQCVVGSGSLVERLADSAPEFDDRSGDAGSRRRVKHSDSSATGRLAESDSARREPGNRNDTSARSITAKSGLDGLEHPNLPGQHGRTPGREQSLCDFSNERDEGFAIRNPRQTRSFDNGNVDWLLCRNPAGEPNWRPVESGTFPLHHGHPGRMGKLRAYGNALDFETATQFCEVVKEIADEI